MSEDNAVELILDFVETNIPAVQELLTIFGAQGKNEQLIDARQRASASFKQALESFVSKYANTAPEFHKLKKIVRDLRDDEFFLLLPEPPSSTEHKFELENFLHQLNYPDQPSQNNGLHQLFGPLLQQYDITKPRVDRHTVIGNRHRSKRKCRFCQRTAVDGASFKSAAHAIPKALGNDFLKLGDECDECNSYFGREIEPSLIALLDIQRAFLGIQGRSSTDGRPMVLFSDGSVFHDGKKLNIRSRNVSKNDATGVISAELGKGAPIKPVDCYRGFVKIAISVIPGEQLPYLSQTISWLRYGKHADIELPAIATRIIGFPPSPLAEITLYIRKSNTISLPHIVAEFRLSCFVYVYAIPLSDRDTGSLVGFFDEPDFRDTFRHYAKVGSWTMQNFNGKKRSVIAPQLKFVPSRAASTTV
jgi:hypothetical protein